MNGQLPRLSYSQLFSFQVAHNLVAAQQAGERYHVNISAFKDLLKVILCRKKASLHSTKSVARHVRSPIFNRHEVVETLKHQWVFSVPHSSYPSPAQIRFSDVNIFPTFDSCLRNSLKTKFFCQIEEHCQVGTKLQYELCSQIHAHGVYFILQSDELPWVWVRCLHEITNASTVKSRLMTRLFLPALPACNKIGKMHQIHGCHWSFVTFISYNSYRDELTLQPIYEISMFDVLKCFVLRYLR